MKSKWYVVPPYDGVTWKVLNEAGELVAVFEDKDECQHVVDLHNESLTAAPQHKS